MMESKGEEAVAVGATAALKTDDHIISSAREQGCLVFLGFELKRIVGQAFANEADLGKGRQMPVHVRAFLKAVGLVVYGAFGLPSCCLPKTFLDSP